MSQRQRGHGLMQITQEAIDAWQMARELDPTDDGTRAAESAITAGVRP